MKTKNHNNIQELLRRTYEEIR